MNGYDDPNDDQQPLMWLRGYAVYAAHFIVLVFVTSMLVTTTILAFNLGDVLKWVTFQSGDVLRGQVWRVLTYGLVNPPSLFFAADMFIMAWFGRELEKFFGRRIFLRFFFGLYLLAPLLFTVIGLRWPMSLSGEIGGFALFIAFATLYPGVAMFFGILAKWMAVILVGILTLVALAYHDWPSLIILWAATGYSYGFVRFEQGRFTLPSFRFNQRKPKLRVLPDLQKDETISINLAKDDSMAEMDALLDKIARSGMSSLTTKERSKLAKAREELMQKKTERS